MKIYIEPEQKDWPLLLKRPVINALDLEKKVRRILSKVEEKGDKGVRKYTKEFDGAKLKDLRVSARTIQQSGDQLSDELKQAIRQAASNIRRFHEAQWQEPVLIETMPGVKCWRKSVGIEKVGLYIPGGTAPLFSTILMLGIPAVVAGCKEVILCSPPNREGELHPAILYAASVVGISTIFRCGGVQAIGAMAYGTESIPKVDKIFGPGNQFVTCAKQLVQQQGVAIDMPAGPSEVAVYADHTAVPAYVAADLLSQAEHGADSQVLLVTSDKTIADAVQAAIQSQLQSLPRKAIAEKALLNSRALVIADRERALQLLNQYAAEHLILSVDKAAELAQSVVNAGSVFIGNYSPESVGDYASGTNHTLPTNGYARAYSGVSVDSFVKKITFQELDQKGLEAIGSIVESMAVAEGLEAHANAVRVRRLQ